MSKKRTAFLAQRDLFRDRSPEAAVEPALEQKPEPPAPLAQDVEYLQSREHALLIEPIVGEQRRKVLEFARSCGATGYTIYELQNALVFGKAEWVSRAVELTDAGLIVDSGRVMELPDQSPTIWIAVPTKWWPAKEGEGNVKSQGA